MLTPATVTIGSLTYGEAHLDFCDSVELWIDAPSGSTVTVYILDGLNFLHFLNKNPFRHYGPGELTSFRSTLTLPRLDKWRIIVENQEPRPITIHIAYEPHGGLRES